MKQRVDVDKQILTIYLSGDIDEFAVRTLKTEIDSVIDNNAGVRAVVFDMQTVSFVDSTGIGFLFGRYKRLKEIGAELLLKNVSKQVDKVFRTSGVYKFVPIVD